MDSATAAWIAGFLDGDGSVSVKQRHGVDIRASQGEKKKDILEFIQSKAGGSVTLDSENDVNQNSWRWLLNGASAVELAKEISPHMIVKQGEIGVAARWSPGNKQQKGVIVHGLGPDSESKTFSSHSKAAKAMGITQSVLSKAIRGGKTKVRGCDFTFEAIADDWVDDRPALLAEYERIERPIDELLDCIATPIGIEHVAHVSTLASVEYLAGLSEADGCFCIAKHNAKDRPFRVYCTVGQRSNFILLQYLKVFGFGKIYFEQCRYEYKGVVKLAPKYEWVVYDTNAIEYITRILPHVKSNAVRRQIEIIIEYGPTAEAKEMILSFKGVPTN